MLLAAIINQEKIKNPRRQLNWDTILRLADYQHVVVPIYCGMLGVEKEVSDDFQDRFHQKYKKELLLRESYLSAEEVIAWQLETNKIHAVFLWGSEQYNYYPQVELDHKEKIEIVVEEKHLPKVHRFMLDMNYEKKEDRVGSGLIYERTPGIRIVFYSEFPIGNKTLKRYFSDPLKVYTRAGKGKYIHRLIEEETYLYLAGRLVELFITGELRVREIMDWMQYRKSLGEGFPWKETQNMLGKAKLEEFIHQIELLSHIWFEGAGDTEEGTTALELEEYILSSGKENRRLETRILPYERMRLDFYRRDREEEWEQKQKSWWFPSKEYMASLFPILNKFPFLLGFFFIVRVVRLLWNLWKKDIKRKWLEIKLKLGNIIGGRRKGQEELNNKTGVGPQSVGADEKKAQEQ